jgi:hypothetical protein
VVDVIFNGGCRVGAICVPGVIKLTTELGVSKIDTHGVCIGGRAVLGQDLDVCALDATSSMFIASSFRETHLRNPTIFGESTAYDRRIDIHRRNRVRHILARYGRRGIRNGAGNNSV